MTKYKKKCAIRTGGTWVQEGVAVKTYPLLSFAIPATSKPLVPVFIQETFIYTHTYNKATA
jgi:hypothetical protein